MKLIHEDGKVVKIGDAVVTFNGEKATVTGWEEPRHSGSTGRMNTTHGRGEHYPSVFGCKFISDEEVTA